jgi:hypothetical protein
MAKDMGGVFTFGDRHEGAIAGLKGIAIDGKGQGTSAGTIVAAATCLGTFNAMIGWDDGVPAATIAEAKAIGASLALVKGASPFVGDEGYAQLDPAARKFADKLTAAICANDAAAIAKLVPPKGVFFGAASTDQTIAPKDLARAIAGAGGVATWLALDGGRWNTYVNEPGARFTLSRLGSDDSTSLEVMKLKAGWSLVRVELPDK